ncbi:MAG: helix-turn-helix domain-containing protein [Gammaproteobacteria bacterium]|nr:helix-turn-helix domain-containing protein [Gammaproteobacteria bacterium]
MAKTGLANILSRILFEKKIKPIELARELDIPQPTMHRIVTGKSPNPHNDTVEPIAKYFDLTVDQLKGIKPLPHNLFAGMSLSADKRVIEIPLVEWKDLPNLNDPAVEKQSIAAMADLSSECFGVYMNDSSMEPQFSKGSVLIFDPTKTFIDRSYVLIKLSNGNYTFRQIIVDTEHQFLKPLNPDLIATQIRLLAEDDQVIGVLVEARQVYNYA